MVAAERAWERLRHLERLIRDMLLLPAATAPGASTFAGANSPPSSHTLLEPVGRPGRWRSREDRM